MKKALIFSIKFVVTVLLIGWAISTLDFSKFGKIISNANYFFIALSVMTWPIGIWVAALKWHVLLRNYAIPIGLKNTFILYWICTFFNNFLPSAIGGDGYKFFFINRFYVGRRAATLASILLDRFFGLYPALVLGIFFSLPFLDRWLTVPWMKWCLYIIACFGATLPLILWFFIKKQLPVDRVTIPVVHNILRLGNIILAFRNWHAMAQVLLFGSIFFILSIVSYHFLFKSLDVYVPVLLIIFLVPVISVIELLPISINSIGLKEGSAVYLFMQLGVPSEATLGVFLISRVAGTLLSLVGGGLYLFEKKIHPELKSPL